MKYNLVLEFIEDEQKFNALKNSISDMVREISRKTQNGKVPYAKNNNHWKQIVSYYAEFVEELENYKNTLHKSKNYKPKGFIRAFEKIRKNEMFDKWLEEIGYRGNYINAAEISPIVYKFFTSGGYIRNNLDQATADLLNQTNNRLRVLLRSQPSVKTN